MHRPNKIGDLPFHFIQQSEILTQLKLFFQFSKFFSGVPLIKFQENMLISSGFFSVATLWAVFLFLNQIILLSFTIIKGNDFVRSSGTEIIMRVHILLVHGWSFLYSSKFLHAMRATPYVEKRLQIYTELKDVGVLRRRCLCLLCAYVLVGIGLTVALASSILFLTGSSFGNAWSQYSTEACSIEPNTLFHLTLTNIYCLVINLLGNFSWLFGDFLLILLSLVFSNFYVRLIRGINGIDPSRFTLYEIDLIREHFGIISKLVLVSFELF